MCEITMAQKLPASPLYSTIATAWTGKGHIMSIGPWVGEHPARFYEDRQAWEATLRATLPSETAECVREKQGDDMMRFVAGGLLLIKELHALVSHALCRAHPCQMGIGNAQHACIVSSWDRH
jgi:hypothetical protein